MWNAARSDRRPLQIVGLALLILTGTGLSGCLGNLEPPAAAPATPSVIEAQPRPEVSVAPVSDPEVLRIQGDETLDRLAARTGWAGAGTLAEPYVITDLQLHGRTLVLQDLTRLVVLQGADLRGPDDGPALVVWNVTGFRIDDSTIHATGGPALTLLESRWCTVDGSTLHSDEEAIQATASEAIDLIDNDLHAGTTAIRANQDGGDHWIEANRVHTGTTGILLDGGQRPSLVLNNVIRAETGIVVRDAPGPVLEDNRLEGRDGIRLDGTHKVLVLNTTINATGLGLAVRGTDDWVAEDLRIDGGGAGLEITGGTLGLVANLTYSGPGPAVAAEGGDTFVLVTPQIYLEKGKGDGMRFRGTRSPVILDGLVHLGERGIVMEETNEGSVIGSSFAGMTGPAIVADRTEATVVAESSFDALGGVHLNGGSDHQVAENQFRAQKDWSIRVEGVGNTYLGHNTIETGGRILATASSGTHIEANQLIKGHGIAVLGDRDTVIRSNVLTRTWTGINVADQQPEGTLRIEGNELTSTQDAGLTLDNVSGFIVRTNALMTQRKIGLVLDDVAHGHIYDNWFDNLFNVAASGKMEDVHWSVEATPGQNIAGGPLLAGNWWNSYYGTDADEDGIGDVPYLMLPYDDSLDRVGAPTTHVEDETPLVADETIPGLPTALPVPDSVQERLAALLGLHPTLDAFVAPRM